MKTVILCGGQGTRMREETEYRPKPLVDIGGRPILWHIMKIYAHFGYHEFILCLGYRGQMIKDYFLNYEAMSSDFTISLGVSTKLEFHGSHDEQDYQITLADTGLETMTGARVKRVGKYLGDGPFMVTYGDGLTNINVDNLLEFHKSHGRLATVTVVKPESRFGRVDFADDGTVQKFAEKPQAGSWVSAGFFVFEQGVLDYISDDKNCILERAPLEGLARDRQLVAYQHSGPFYAMDTYREYLQLNKLWDERNAPWKIW